MKQAPYPEYKDSGVPWLSSVPIEWKIERAKNLFAESNIPVDEKDEIVTCFRDGQVTLRRNRRERGYMNAFLEVGYQGVRTNQLVVHAMDAFAGAIGVSDSDGKCTPEYVVLNARRPEINLHYYALVLREMARLDFIRVVCPAVRERAPRLRYPNLASMCFPVPESKDQLRIVRFSYNLKNKIGVFIRNKRRLIELFAEMREAITQDALKSKDARQLRLGVVADRLERPVLRRDEEFYTPIGLFNRGRGIFHKKLTKGADLGDSSFFWIEEGDLIFSGQFAWEGAVALAGKNDAGCIASHRYPILRGKPGLVQSAYLLSFFKTRTGHLLLDLHSRGAAGRNRPLNARTLLKEKIPIPPLHTQQKIAQLVKHEADLMQDIAREIALVREYRTRLISDVVTGKVDVGGIEVPEVAEEELLELDEDAAEEDNVIDDEGDMDETD